MRVWSTECTNAQSTEWESDAYTLQATMAGLNGDSKEREINTQTYLEKVKKKLSWLGKVNSFLVENEQWGSKRTLYQKGVTL